MVAAHAHPGRAARGEDHLSLRLKTSISFVLLGLIILLPFVFTGAAPIVPQRLIRFDAVGGSATVCCNPAVVANTTSFTLAVTSGDAIVVTTGNYDGILNHTPLCRDQTQSVTDTNGDIFTHRITQCVTSTFSSSLASDNEIWTAFTNFTGTVTITAKSNASQTNAMIFAVGASYQNVRQFGSVNGTETGGFPPVPGMNVTLTGTQSWFVGGAFQDDISCTSGSGQSITSGKDLFQRLFLTGFAFGNGQNDCADLQDTNNYKLAQPFLSTNKFLYNETFNNNIGSFVWITVAIELSPTQVDLQNECTTSTIQTSACPITISDTDPFCSPTGDTCHVNMATRAAGGINTLQTVASGTQYCTGITTSALTLTASTSNVVVTGTYSAVDTNVTFNLPTTDAKLLIQLYQTTTAPSTTFGSGLCQASGSVVPGGLTTITFANSGTNGQYNINYYSSSTTGSSFIGSPSTVYYFIEITPQLIGAGHMSMAQWGASPNSQLVAWQSH